MLLRFTCPLRGAALDQDVLAVDLQEDVAGMRQRALAVPRRQLIDHAGVFGRAHADDAICTAEGTAVDHAAVDPGVAALEEGPVADLLHVAGFAPGSCSDRSSRCGRSACTGKSTRCRS